MVRQHHTTVAIALTLALAGSLAPAASADPAPVARAEAAIAAITATHGSAVVRPNPDNQYGTVASTDSGPCSEVCSGGAGSYGSVTQLAQTLDQPAARLPLSVHPAGFHWLDAGIGAAGSLVLVGLGLAGMRAATNSRRRRTRQQRAIATN
jgi:hypothetical protein